MASHEDPQNPSLPARYHAQSDPYAGQYADPYAGPPALAAGQAAPGGLKISALLKAFARHWVLALTLGVLGSGAVAALCYILMPAGGQTAIARLLVTPRAANALDPIDYNVNSAVTRAFQKNQLAIVKSRQVLGGALNDDARNLKALPLVKAQPDPIEWLEGSLKADFNGDILQLTLSSQLPGKDTKGEPKQLVRVLEGIVDAYTAQLNSDKSQLKVKINECQILSRRYGEELNKKRAELALIAKSAGTDKEETLTFKEQLDASRMSEVQRELNMTSISLEKAKIQLKQAEQQAGVAVVASPRIAADAVDALVAQDPNVQQMKARIQDLKDTLDKTSITARNTGTEPLSRKARAEIAQLEADLARYQAAVRPEAEKRVRALAAQGASGNPAQDRLAALRSEVDFLRSYELVLKNQVNQMETGSKVAVEASSRIADLQSSIRLLEGLVEKIANQEQTLEISFESTEERSRVIDTPSIRGSEAKRKVMVAVGAFTGTFALIVLGITFLEYSIRRVNSVKSVAEDLGLRLVGALPATPTRSRFALPGQGATQEAYWRSRLNESVNAIRTTLLRQSQLEPLQVVMVTSATVGEGKTSLACHLATSLARAGRRTLLLDCDLRNPTAHRVFDLPLQPGLSEVLRGQVPLEEASHPIALGDLRMITAGRCDTHSLHALGLEPMRAIFERLRQHYDFIVVDTPPVLPVADTLLLGQFVDAALFSILRDVSRVPKVHSACDRLGALGVRILGAVVAGAPVETHGAEYYYTAAYAGDAAAAAGETP